MALLPDDTRLKDGIQLGGPNTLCYKCEAERKVQDRDSIPKYGTLQYKEVFKIVQNGSEMCLCMDHFKQMCAESHYMLVDTNECMIVPLGALEDTQEESQETESTSEEVKVEQPDKQEEVKTKKKTPSKKDK